MKISSPSFSFSDYEIDLNYYHGKDIVHEGCLLILNQKEAWNKISSKIRNKIRQAEKLQSCEIKRVKGTKKNLALFRSIWFDPKDVTLPDKLSNEDYFYLAYLNEVLVGGLILSPVGSNLFMHNLGASEEGKQHNIPSLLLWHAVKDLEHTKYKYIDVGVSFRKNLYNYFQNWQTASYPIIFEPPFLAPRITLSPFTSSHCYSYKNSRKYLGSDSISDYFGTNFTILPRAIHCIKNILQYLKLNPDENVAVYTTFDTDYISRCVSETILSFCQLRRNLNEKTRAVMVIHEFGYPCKRTLELRKICDQNKIPLIENCAWSLGSHIDEEHAMGDVGDFAVFSLPKFLPMQYGGILKGLSISDEDNWSVYRTLDFYKREIIQKQLEHNLPNLITYNKKKRENWKYLFTLFDQDGFEPYAQLEPNTYPSAFMVKLEDYSEVYDRYSKFGIESGKYYHGKSLFLPIHHNLSTEELDYIYAVFRGRLNLCSTYKRQK